MNATSVKHRSSEHSAIRWEQLPTSSHSAAGSPSSASSLHELEQERLIPWSNVGMGQDPAETEAEAEVWDLTLKRIIIDGSIVLGTAAIGLLALALFFPGSILDITWGLR